MRYPLRSFAGLLTVVLAGLLAGCATTRPEEVPPDEQFGHRPEDSRTVAVLAPPDSTQQYFYYPAPVDTVHTRPQAFETSRPGDMQEVAVEVLIKGALPDACTELHAVSQQRAAHLIDVVLEMRRPQGAVCATVVRPYRFYVMLEGRYGPGHYTLKVNGGVTPFVIRAPEDGTTP